MKRIYTVSVFAMFFLLLFSACELFLPAKGLSDIKAADPGDFEVDLQRISLNASELATVVGRPVELRVSKVPANPSPGLGDLKWTSSNTDVATVNASSGEITLQVSDISDPVSTLIRVEALRDPSIYALCALTVYPKYPNSRRWNFPAHPTGGSSADDISGDVDAGGGFGGTILQGTGNGSGYTSGGGPEQYIIDPEDPYEFGLTPNGGARSGLTWVSGGGLNSSRFHREPGEAASSTNYLRTNGAARFFRIAALFGPFEVIVNYASHASENRWADIRIGDREGIRIEGTPSSNTTDGQVVRYVYEAEEFVPFVFIECSASIRCYDIYVLGAPEAPVVPVYKPVQSVNIIGGGEVVTGATLSLNSVLAPVDATSPTYKWEISSGAANGEISGADNAANVTVKGLSAGEFTVKVTVTTTDPDNPSSVATQTDEKVIETITLPSGPAQNGHLYNFSQYPFSILPATWATGTVQEIGDITFIDRGAYNSNSKTIDGVSYTYRLQLQTRNNKGSDASAIKFDVTGSCTVRVSAISGNSDEIRVIAMSDGDTDVYGAIAYEGSSGGYGDYTYTGGPATLYLYCPDNISGMTVTGADNVTIPPGTPLRGTCNVYGIKVTYD